MIKFIFLFLIFFQNIYASEIILTQKEKDFIQKHPVITLAGGASFEPFLIKNGDGSISGYDADIVKLIKDQTGLNIEFELGNWQEIQIKAKNRELDGLSTSGYGGDRKKYFTHSIPYLELTPIVFINKKNPKKIYTLSDLEGKKVAVQKGNLFSLNLVKSLGNVEIVYYETMHDLIRAVVSNEVDFTVIDETAFYIANQIGLGSFIDNAFALNKHNDVLFSLRNDKPQLVSIVNKALKNISVDKKNALRKKWFKKEKIYNSTVNFTSDEKKYLQGKKQLNLCVDPNWMPYAKVENGKYIGIGADIVDIIESKLPISIKLVNTKSWQETLEFARQRKCDIVDLAIQTQKREAYLNFTSKYIKIPLVIATKLDAAFIIDFKTLKDKKIGIVKDYAFLELLKNKYPNLDIVEVDSISDGLQKVKDKKLFGYVGVLASVAYEFKENFTGELKISGRFEESMQMGSSVRNDDITLFNIIQKVINSIDKNEINKIITKWIAIKYEKEFDYTLFWRFFLVILIVALFLMYRQYLLKKQNITLEKLVDKKTNELKEINENLKQKIIIEVEKNNKQQQQIFEQSKITSMAEMIRNIAHHWRQPLNVISTIASGIKLNHELKINQPDENSLENMDAIIKNTQFLSETINIFANFLKEEKNGKEISLYDVIDFSLKIVNTTLKDEDIEIIKNIDYDNPMKVFIVKEDLSQVIINILTNAKDVLIDRKTENKCIELNLSKEDDKALLTIEDNAGGIDDQLLTKIFEPYFTTKHQSQDTGLGLYLCYKIVTESLKGKLYVKNTNKGAKFFIELPLKQ